MWNERNKDRKNPTGTYSVYERYSNRYVGKLYNMSNNGIMICSDKPTSPYQLYHLRIDMPVAIDNRTRINFDAECRWCRKEDKERCYYSGFQFAAIPDSDRKTVELLLEKWESEVSGAVGNNIDLKE